MRRTAGDEQIHRQYGARAVVNLCVTDEWATGNRASTHGNHDFRRGDSVVGFLERQFHVLGHWAGDEQTVRVARRRDELDSKPPQVPAVTARSRTPALERE